MELKVTVEMVGPPDEVAGHLRLLAGGLTEQTGTSTPVEPGYSAELVEELVERITDDARKALLFIAQNGPQVSMNAVQEHLGMDGIRLGGVMASFGFAEKAGIPRPFRKDGNRRLYLIEPAVAATVTAVLGDSYEAQAA